MFPGMASGEQADQMGWPVGWGVGLGLFLAVILIDICSPPEVEFSAFYLMPVIWLAWSRGTREGIWMALTAGVGWYIHDRLSGRPMSSEFFRFWDALNHQLSYLLAAWVVGALRREVQTQRTLNQKLNEAMSQVRELKGLLPVCAWCHQIRDEAGEWHSMEGFLLKRTRAAATHSICPACLAKEVPDMESS